MVILSYEFALCFMVFFVLYWACRQLVNVQNALLTLAGLVFIGSWSWQFLLSLIFVWSWTQLAVLLFGYIKQQKAVLVLALIGLVVHLCFFKYTNFAIAELNELLPKSKALVSFDIVLPLGISFYTFQAISYLVDVYNKKMPALPSTVFLGFLSFVPTLVAGPIFRAKNAQNQWLPDKNVASRQLLYPYLAMALIMMALVKKIVLASWLETLWVNPVFGNPLQFNGLEVITGVYAYALQLFFDFSGYTDLAIALGLLLGFSLPKNFNRPYLASDIQDFWARWHITLSHWIKDYIYIPLGGNRCGYWRVQLNLMLAFVVSGVWHGAGWNFFIWGALHGLALVGLNIMKSLGVRGWLTQKAKPVAILLTFHYVALGWVFFRNETLAQALQMIKAMTNLTVPFSLSIGLTLPMMLVAWLIYPYLGKADVWLARGLSKVYWWCLPIVFAVFVLVVFAVAPEGLPGFIYANF